MRKIYFLLLTTLLAVVSNAQVSVTATAGTTGPTAYTNLSSAFTAINAGTHQGAITVDITASYTDVASAVLNSSGAGAATYTSVAIRPTADAVTVSFPSVTGRGVIELNGADNVTIDGDNPNSGGTNRNLTITNTAANTVTFTSCVRLATSTLVTSCDNVTVKNCILNGSGTGRNTSSFTSEVATWGIIASAGASTVAATTAPSPLTSATTTIVSGQTALNFIASNNAISTCSRGIAINGAATTVCPILTVTNNTIGNPTSGAADQVYLFGITAQGFSTGTLIAGNTVYLEGFISGLMVGIDAGTVSAAASNNGIIERNTISRVLNSSTSTFGACGINLATSGAADLTVRNNFVTNINHDMSGGFAFSTTFGVYGIRISTGTGNKIYYNSVNLFGLSPGLANSSLLSAALCIVLSSSTGTDVRNNIFSNTITGGTSSIANVSVYLPTSGTSAMGLTLNNNVYYTGSTAGVSGVAHVGTTYTAVPAGATTFAGLYTAANFSAAATSPSANFRSYTSTLSPAGTNDNASSASTLAAPFVSASNLHISTANASFVDLNDKGAAIAGITTDFDNDVRGATPDIGADEFPPPPCSIVCPGNITVNVDPNQCGAVVTYAAPTTTGSCGVVTTSPASGSFFPKGTTTVTATSTIGGGVCTFLVTVVDNQAPVITCPANITVNSTAGQCGAIVTFSAPVASDNCPGVTVTSIPASGSFFPAGPTATTVTSTATDAAGNTTTCTFTVKVNDTQAPVVTCPANITVSNTANQCGANVTFTSTAIDNCSQFSLTQSSSTSIVTNNAVACPTGLTSWWRAYQLAAPAPVTMDKVTFGIESSTAGSKPITVRMYTSAGAFPGGVLTQVASQVFNIPAQTNTLFTGTFTTPPVIPGNAILVLEVNSDVTTGAFFIGSNTAAESAPSYLSSVACGLPTPGTAASIGFPDMHIILNASGFIPMTVTSVPASGSLFPVGTTTVTSTATDASGNSASCTFTVKVNDTQAPVFTCPANITVTSAIGSCTAPVTYAATATDNCPGVVVTRTAGPASGSAFPVGVTTVTHTATDAAGNISTCTFTVTVLDGQLPVISAQPANRSVCNGLNTTFTVTSTNAVSYQWQQFIGGVWTNIAGATAATLPLNAVTLGMNTNSYRVNVIGLCSTVTSGFATLFVNPLPTISLTATNAPVLLPNQFTSIVATVVPTGGTFAWFKNGAPLVPAVTTGVLSNLTIDNAGTYRAVYTDLNGCVNTSADLVLSAEVSNNLFISPNPNFGQFSVRYYNQANENVTVSVFNSNGARVYQKTAATTLAYTKIDVDLLTNAPGVYLVELRNAGGKLLAHKKIIVGHK